MYPKPPLPIPDVFRELATLLDVVSARSAPYAEEEDERAEKRRKTEAEEKAKKASVSRGVKNLMKVNTTGMKKMSDFFKKKA